MPPEKLDLYVHTLIKVHDEEYDLKLLQPHAAGIFFIYWLNEVGLVSWLSTKFLPLLHSGNPKKSGMHSLHFSPVVLALQGHDPFE